MSAFSILDIKISPATTPASTTAVNHSPVLSDQRPAVHVLCHRLLNQVDARTPCAHIGATPLPFSFVVTSATPALSSSTWCPPVSSAASVVCDNNAPLTPFIFQRQYCTIGARVAVRGLIVYFTHHHGMPLTGTANSHPTIDISYLFAFLLTSLTTLLHFVVEIIF